MTQELIIWVLLAGSVGMIWVLTCALLTQDHSPRAASESEDSVTTCKDAQASRPNQERSVAS